MPSRKKTLFIHSTLPQKSGGFKSSIHIQSAFLVPGADETVKKQAKNFIHQVTVFLAIHTTDTRHRYRGDGEWCFAGCDKPTMILMHKPRRHTTATPLDETRKRTCLAANLIPPPPSIHTTTYSELIKEGRKRAATNKGDMACAVLLKERKVAKTNCQAHVSVCLVFLVDETLCNV